MRIPPRFLHPCTKDALAIASKLDALPQVGQTRTIASFVPSDQERELSLIRHAASVLAPALTAKPQAEPTDAVDIINQYISSSTIS
jgi:uncharacterized protein